ncbi:MAG TPA: hypothetical protein VIJ95_15945 [Hanamia sp.]
MQRLIKLTGFFFITVFWIFCLISCNKPHEPSPLQPNHPNPPDTSVLAPEFQVDNSWECEINGVKYSGYVDTSFLQIYNNSEPDTFVVCSGTTSDRKANIQFRFPLNRRQGEKYNIEIPAFESHLIFDTLSLAFLITPFNTPYAQVQYTIDTVISNKIKGRFSGTLLLNPDINTNGPLYPVVNGKFSFQVGHGTNEPKTFSFQNDNSTVAGYFLSARMISNTLILDGLPYGPYAWQTFKLQIRTGGTIKPGVYININGDASLQYYTPSHFVDFINDTLGTLKVTINSVNGNIIHGSFDGNNEYFQPKPISNGQFTCRVKDYLPQIDSTNKWGLSENSGFMNYRMFGGNILNAIKTESTDKYFLTINGESDFGRSQFQIVLSSTTPIDTGLYQSGNDAKRFGLIFNSNEPESKRGYYIDDRVITYCRIDYIDSNIVKGTFYGPINNYTGGNVSGFVNIKEGTFKASF